MPLGRVKVEKRDDEFVIRIVECQSGIDIVEQCMTVFRNVNSAAQLPAREQQGPLYQRLYNEGPLLFNEVAIDPKTGEHHTLLGGLTVSPSKLDATIAEFRNLDFEVDA